MDKIVEKCIDLLFDKYTIEKENPDRSFTKTISGNHIELLKVDIKELFEENNNEDK